MARYDYNKEHFQTVIVCGIECQFNDMRIERSSVPQGMYHYEVAGDDDSGGDPVRVAKGYEFLAMQMMKRQGAA